MNKLFKHIIRKNSIIAGAGLFLMVAGGVCLIVAGVKTVKDVRNTVTAALNDYTEKQLVK